MFFITGYSADISTDNESSYADYMAEHPRPPPVDKKAANLLATGIEAGSPAPEGSYPPSDGTPADPMSESGATPGQIGAPAGRGSGRGRGRGSGRGTGARRKPGPPKKNKALPPPIVGPISEAAPAMDNLASTALTAEPSLATSTTSNADTPNVDDAASTSENQPKDASNMEPASVESQDTSMAAAV